jgi:small subunit ribosomal protein S16
VAVTIRLARHGKHKVPFYRIVVTDREMKRDGRHIERIGTINPLVEPPAVTLNEERVRYWVGVGAKPSDTVSQIIEKRLPGFLKEKEAKQREKIRARRAKRKARAGKAPAKAETKAKAAAPKKKAAKPE